MGSHKEVPQELLAELSAICGVSDAYTHNEMPCLNFQTDFTI